jgi:hypothetical protein
MTRELKKSLADLQKEKAEQATEGMLEVTDLPSDDEDEPGPDKPLPDWAVLPEGIRAPEGWQVWFVRFPAKMTNYPKKGDRTCVLWNLSVADEKLASRKARGDSTRIIDELTQQMIRVVDGVRADWTGAKGPGSIELFWNEVGAKCRHQLKALYVRTHTMSPEENADFFVSGVAVRTAG